MRTTMVEVKGTALETFLSIGEASAKFIDICSVKYDEKKDQMVVKIRRGRKKNKLIIKGVSRNKDVRELLFNMRKSFLNEKQKAKESTQKKEEP